MSVESAGLLTKVFIAYSWSSFNGFYYIRGTPVFVTDMLLLSTMATMPVMV